MTAILRWFRTSSRASRPFSGLNGIAGTTRMPLLFSRGATLLRNRRDPSASATTRHSSQVFPDPAPADFDPDTREVVEKFDFEAQIGRLDRATYDLALDPRDYRPKAEAGQ